MAQSALTVTTPNPSPPTNMASTGCSPPNPPNYTKLSYAGAFAVPQTNPPPYFDDGTAGALVTFATNTAALASGTSTTSGGTENTYPGTGSGVSGTGAVPASTSVANEGAGTEVLVTATSANPGPYGQLQTTSCLGNFTGVANPTTGVSTSPNATHASSMSPITNPALVSIAPTTLAAATTGTQVITCTGTNFKPGCRIWHDGFEQDTTYTNATTISATVKKRTSAGVAPVVVKLGGVQMGAAPNFTWT